ncbi:MAG: AmmeMemoRadiSam system protein B [Bryobacteraceae bacterium]|jgi:AmmeMemoRadiSam system protein B/AmmeMemoRadiSam system protein A
MQAAVSHLSPYSGSWYPEDPSELERLLENLFENSEQRTGPYLAPNAAGFVVPHAGLIYSGTVAAAAYRHLRAAPPARIVLLGFAHRGAPPGVWIPELDAYRTPLGEVAVDREALRALLDGGEYRSLPEAVLCDHSVEIQLPLIQRAAPGARIVPVYVSHLEAQARAAAARRLAALIRPGTILAASSDLTHYGRAFGYQPFPAHEWVAERLRDLDESVIEAAGSLSPDLFLATLQTTGSTVCGYDPIALLLETLRSLEGDEIFQETLDYQTSGDITGDFKHSVSYGALGYFPSQSFHLGPEEQALLLASARQTLEYYVSTGERKPIPPERITPGLERRAGAFVTLHGKGDLRGCVGRRSSTEPLWQTVPALTLAAALEDSRFRPVRKGEAGLEVEISVLSPFKRLADLGDFRVNQHGALLEAGLHHGLLLPQVATERNWTAQQFLDALAHKTGVSRDVYRDPSTRVSVFRAQIIQ